MRVSDGLTVVIPAYKPDFLDVALQSLVQQTDTDFAVVVGDDAGPPEIAALARAHADRLALRYYRFDRNLGGTDLAAQWQRCVDLADSTWVMVLGDDDVLDPGAVASFRAALRGADGEGDLYRFDTRQIDAAGAVLRENPVHPGHQTSTGFLAARFRGQSSYLNEFVVRIDALRRCGGFVSFPMGWCSDDATWMLVGERDGIRRIPGAKVSWRLSGRNISSTRPETGLRKLAIVLDFVQWVERWSARGAANRLDAAVRAGSVDFFCYRLRQSGVPVPTLLALRWAWRLNRFARVGLWTATRRLLGASRQSLQAGRSAAIAP